MAIVIGAGTQVNFMGACVISANWAFNLNAQRLYCIGEWAPHRTFYKPTETLNLTIYSPGSSHDIEPTQSCTDANTVSASISPAACGDSVNSFSGNWFVTSYSFSKDDAQLPGQESWSLQRWKNLSSSTPAGTIEPDYVLRGISEGSGTHNAGIIFEGDTFESSSGSVSANSMGKSESITAGVVSRVGGGSSAYGETGQASVSIPYTPLFIG